MNKNVKKIIKKMYLEFQGHVDFFSPVSHDDQESYFDLMCRKKGVFAEAEKIKSYFMPYLKN
jgi:nicotinate-nucleotide pyrophosphorylase